MLKDVQQFADTTLMAVGDYEITVGQIIFIPTVLLLGYLMLGWFVRSTTAQMQRRQIDANIVQVVRRAVYILGLIILAITTLDLLKVPLTAFAFVSGAVAIGVGFGAQNIINNFISGWILIWERPIRINDYIETGDTSGTVEEINTRSTRIRRVDGVHILIPNSKLLEETVVNWTLVDKLLRCIVRVGVAYGSDINDVRRLLEQSVADHELVLSDPAPQIIFEDFGDSSLIFDVYFWVYSAGDKNSRQIRSDIRFTIDQLFRDNGITMAFPQRDIHIDGTLQIQPEKQ